MQLHVHLYGPIDNFVAFLLMLTKLFEATHFYYTDVAPRVQEFHIVNVKAKTPHITDGLVLVRDDVFQSQFKQHSNLLLFKKSELNFSLNICANSVVRKHLEHYVKVFENYLGEYKSIKFQGSVQHQPQPFSNLKHPAKVKSSHHHYDKNIDEIEECNFAHFDYHEEVHKHHIEYEEYEEDNDDDDRQDSDSGEDKDYDYY